MLKALLFILLFSGGIGAQVLAQKGYYRFPFESGRQHLLAGSMGEIRGHHFHAGIDIDTGEETGWPVYAAASGYISRIKVSEDGYGLALYMKHPNGHTTVYGHLSSFDKRIADKVRKAQYAGRRYEVELFPKAGELSYAQGQQIGKSGNSGGSEGPHLHFEIRNDKGHALNPLAFGFPEIKDNKPPVVEGLVLKTFSEDSRIEGRFGRMEYSRFRKTDNSYTLEESINAQGLLGLEVRAFDEVNGIDSRNGINKVMLSLDGVEIYKFHVHQVEFSKGRYINLHIDYPAKALYEANYQRCYVEPGNLLGLYTTNALKGKFLIRDQKEHQLLIKLYDSYNNETRVHLRLQHREPLQHPALFKGSELEYFDHYLLFSSLHREENAYARLYFKGKEQVLPPAYRLGNQDMFRWDLRKGLPDSVAVPLWKKSWRVMPLHLLAMLLPGKDMRCSSPIATLVFPKGVLPDTAYLPVRQNGKVLQLGHAGIPLLKSCRIQLRPGGAADARTAVYRVGPDGEMAYEGGSWKDGLLEFSTRELGDFVVLTDKVPPVVRLLSKSPQGIQLTVGDNLSGIDSYEAGINGRWLLMHLDVKKQYMWSERLDERVPLGGKFVLRVRDKAGNIKIFETQI